MMQENEQASNPVGGHPEPSFRSVWIAMQWKAMARTGKGYPRPKQPTRKQQRADAERAKPAVETPA
jgi:hypothetical protein